MANPIALRLSDERATMLDALLEAVRQQHPTLSVNAFLNELIEKEYRALTASKQKPNKRQKGKNA